MMRAEQDHSARTALPLDLRVPNPPPIFFGRESEIQALSAALRRCAVAVLSGPGGVGKTATALQATRSLPGVNGERALFIRLRGGPTVEDPRLQLLHALAAAQGHDRTDWSSCLPDDDSVAAAVIDLADSGGFQIVLDELQHMDHGTAVTLLALIARYARCSRWIVTTWSLPWNAELQAQTIPLCGLPDDMMGQLAAVFMPGLSEIERRETALAAGGSPSRLLHWLAAAGGDAGETPPLGGLSDAELECLRTLTPELRIAGDSRTPSPAASLLPALARRGLILHSHNGYVLHDTVMRLLQHSGGRPPTPAHTPPAAPPWAPETTLEGAQQRLGTGKTAEVVTMLDTWGERLLASDGAAQLWKLLERHHDRRLARWHLRCAVALARPELIAQLEPPRDPAPEELLLWARGLLIQDKVQSAMELASSLHAESHGDRLTFEAGLLMVECLCASRRYHEAVSLLATLASVDADLQALRDSWSLYCLAATDQIDEVNHRLHASQQCLSELPLHVRCDVALNLAKTMSLLGRTRDAYKTACQFGRSTPPTAKQLSVQFALAMELGCLGEAAQMLRQLESLRGEGSPLRHVEAVHRALHQLCVGDLRGCEETIAYWKPELGRLGDPGRLRALMKIETRTRLLRADRPGPANDPKYATLGGLPGRWNQLFNLHWRVRAGEPLPADFDALRETSQRHHRLLADIIRIDALVAQGSAAAALQLCVQVLVEIEHLGWGMMSAELRHTHCDILLILGRWSELEQAARSLHSRASEMPSPRLISESQFFTALVPPKPVDWGMLEVLATRIDTAPIAARRARILLGGESALDVIDRLVLAALREQRGIAPSTSLSSWAPHKPPEPRDREDAGWGLADDERRVWLPNGTSFSLAERPQLWAILAALHERGGTATKEELVQALWNEVEYHPLHHDNRLQVAVRKLRKLIEDEPSRPTRLVTTANGYTLVGRVRRARTRHTAVALAKSAVSSYTVDSALRDVRHTISELR